MLALAGMPLGHTFVFLEPAPEATRDIGEVIVASADDPQALHRLASVSDVVTFEFENVPVAAARAIAGTVPVHPSTEALATAQDRFLEKTFFRALGIPTPRFVAVDSRHDLDRATAALGLPAVLKTRRLGYDGKGQQILRAPADVGPAWGALGGRPLVLEAFVPFSRELSILAVRGGGGAIAYYPLVENHHRDGILRRSLAPAPALTPALCSRAEGYARAVLEQLGYVGVLAIELFQVGDELLVNEMAPRVHNSGHWTIEGAVTSQFENHVRAITGMPLGSTAAVGVSAMVNLVGSIPDPATVLAIPGAHLHLYGKAARGGRKVGHVTLVGEDAAALAQTWRRVELLAG
jgi:5-(carboxyamino)imidazole ribonucleotide synthase